MLRMNKKIMNWVSDRDGKWHPKHFRKLIYFPSLSPGGQAVVNW